MSAPAKEYFETRVYRAAAPTAVAELFPAQIQEVFDTLETLAKNDACYEEGEVRPTKDNIEWATRVLLRVLPRRFLTGAAIDAFHGEIHINWESADKRVVAYLPAPNELKVYVEYTQDGELKHDLHDIGNRATELSAVLRWLYS